MILRCTGKLLAVIGPVLAGQSAPEPDAEDWYANLLWFDRRKCLLLTHSATLFTVFEADVRAAQLRATSRLVSELIRRELVRERLPPDLFAAPGEEVVVARTADRSVLGCMNDMARMCEYMIADSGGLLHLDVGALNRSLRRNINSARSYERPIDLTAARAAPPRQ